MRAERACSGAEAQAAKDLPGDGWMLDLIDDFRPPITLGTEERMDLVELPDEASSLPVAARHKVVDRAPDDRS
jgi:hypothetical protein